MKILVIVPGYPIPNVTMGMYYIHSRNLYYLKDGLDVTVLNFGTNKDYVFDGVRVISLQTYIKENASYDLLISHAANIRNHYRFMRKYGERFNKKIFIFHGGEVLHVNKYYPVPYSFKRRGRLFRVFQDLYDDFKIKVWRKYYLENISDIKMIFVSNWLLNQFLNELKIQKEDLQGNATVISNSIGEFFENNSYEPKNIKYDFIMIRGVLDESKYCVDLFCDLAKKHPDSKLCLIGNGRYFEYNELPRNIEFHKCNLSHKDMKKYLDESKCAFMPTREDTQGLMACEIATYGIPLITSDIDICKEVFDSCENVVLINNENVDYSVVFSAMRRQAKKKWTKYFAKNTIEEEITYIRKYMNNPKYRI